MNGERNEISGGPSELAAKHRVTHDCIVIGGGGVGSGVFHHLARRGVRVLCIDRFGVAHDRGSSHGRTRIIRRAYFEHPDYVPLCDRAYAAWAALEAETGRRLYHETGLMLVGPPEGEAIAGARLSAERHGVHVENPTPSEARRRFPQLWFPDELDVLFEPRAGYLHVEDCVRAHIETAVAAGGTFVTERVVSWAEEPGGVAVRTDRNEYRAERVVVCLGPYHALPAGFRGLRKVQLWFPAGVELDVDRGTPAFLYELPEGVFYGFPRIDGTTIKVAEHSGGTTVDDPDSLDRSLHEDDVAPVARFVESHLPGVDARPAAHSVCRYTMSPDGHFVVGPMPGHDRAYVAMGLSGHGFKFTGVLGEALADLVTDGRTDIPIGFLSPTRIPTDSWPATR